MTDPHTNNKITKNKILDAAEILFSNKGFGNTSLRQITSEAGVNIAAVNYHFGSKDKLITAMFERRLTPLNALRRHLLEKELKTAEKENRLPETREILKAFIDPTIEHIRHPDKKYFLNLMGMAFIDPNELFTDRVLPLLFPILSQFINAFDLALPTVPKDVVMTRFQFSLGAMSHALHVVHYAERRFKNFEGKHPETDPEIIRQGLIDFTQKGMEGQ